MKRITLILALAAAATFGAAPADAKRTPNPGCFRCGSVVGETQMPNPIKWGSANDGIRWSLRPSAVRYRSAVAS